MRITFDFAVSKTNHLDKSHHVHKAITCPCTLGKAKPIWQVSYRTTDSQTQAQLISNLAIHSLYDFATEFYISIPNTGQAHLHPTRTWLLANNEASFAVLDNTFIIEILSLATFY